MKKTSLFFVGLLLICSTSLTVNAKEETKEYSTAVGTFKVKKVRGDGYDSPTDDSKFIGIYETIVTPRGKKIHSYPDYLPDGTLNDRRYTHYFVVDFTSVGNEVFLMTEQTIWKWVPESEKFIRFYSSTDFYFRDKYETEIGDVYVLGSIDCWTYSCSFDYWGSPYGILYFDPDRRNFVAVRFPEIEKGYNVDGVEFLAEQNLLVIVPQYYRSNQRLVVYDVKNKIWYYNGRKTDAVVY